MPLEFKNELTFQSFREFAQDNVKYAYMQALTATHSGIKSEKLAAKALFLVLKNKKHFEAESKPVDEKTAIDLSLRPLLNNKEKDMLDNAPSPDEMLDEILEDDDNTKERFRIYPPDENSSRKIINKACAKAESITPKYAPMYTGTKSGIILLFVLVFICGAIFFIWNDPADLLTDKSTSYSSSSAASVPDSKYLIDVEFAAGEASQGSVPVQIYISGPDRNLVSGVTYSPEASSIISSAYQCGDEYWVMMASTNSYYKVNVKGSNGLDVVEYFRVKDAIPSAPVVNVTDIENDGSIYTVSAEVSSPDSEITVSSADLLNYTTENITEYKFYVPFNKETTVYFCDSFGNQTALFISADGRAVVSPTLSAKEISMNHDSSLDVNLGEMLPSERDYTISVSSDSENISASVSPENILTLTSSDGFVGVAKIKISITDNYGLSTETTLPVIVSNSAPYYKDPTELYSAVSHTPSNSGHLFGTLSASDAQSDKLTYTLTGQTDCSVTLAPGGSFMLFIDPDYRGHSASFDFTVSDGILSSEQYRYTVSLENNIIKAEKYNQKFVCYTGEEGWYALDLPRTDSDGDILNWSVVSEITDDGMTPEGNYISFADGLSTVLIRPNPARNEKFSETISLVCSDGWLNSDVITVKCSFTENQPPKAGKENRAVVNAADNLGTFSLDIRDDCEFDRCVIKEVISCTGGEVLPYAGWSNLMFTVKFDSAPMLPEDENSSVTSPVKVILLVEDVVTKETVEVEYTITRETSN